ncbi:MAG: 2-oxoglutarate dehydrogenase, E2 component, dihydrolipoamide succinyltransferase [Ignavibacteria bacterium]|jgi:2-oxoglutarate dehydrogenase E2 component (dihydrolipoamide succinyltransferase)
MRVDVVMPQMGESLNEGTILKWYKKKGEPVKKDEILLEISTDKVDTEIPSPEEGVLVEIKAFEQETVEVDSVIAVIETNGEAAGEEVKHEPKEESSTTQVGGELVDIPMPKMGESVMEGTIIKWHKQVGDHVKRDEIIFEISTDKVDTEVPSPVEGTLAEIIHGEQDTVEVDTVVARISTTGGIVKPKESKKEEPAEEILSGAKALEKQTEQEEKKDFPKSNKFYSPLVLNIARKENISFDELENIKGSGTGGRVTKKDVLKYLESKKSGKAPSAVSSAPVQTYEAPKTESIPQPKTTGLEFEPGADSKIIPMDNIRKRIMEHMVNSRDTSVHVSAVIEVDMSKIYNYVKKNKDSFFNANGVKLTYMPFISSACIKALKEFPYVNASINDDSIVVKKNINLGFAVAVEPNGLIVPNIKKADEKNIVGLAKAINELSRKSRNKGLVPDDIMDGTFTITNYGVFGTLFGTPIINQPEVGILGVGAITKKPVVIEVDGSDTIAIKPMMYLSLSHDHRLVDGMLGGRFLKSIKDTLENFDVSNI